MCWPVFFRDSLTIGNIDSNVAICTLWTEQKNICSNLDNNSFAVAGNMYYWAGINYVIRNIFLNPNIRYMILCGKDISGSGDALVKLFNDGVDENNKIIGTEYTLDSNIPKKYIDIFRSGVELIDMRGSENMISEKISSLGKLPAFSDKIEFAISEPEAGGKMPSFKSVFVIREKNVSNAWLEVLHKIMNYGCIKKSQHSADQKEIVNMITIIEDEDPENPYIAPFFKFTRQDLDKYYPQVMTSNNIEGINYTYGQRLRFHGGINQIENMAEQLKKMPYTRRAVAVTWNVENDHDNEHAPCWALIQALIQENRLFLTAYIRSNDMFGAWPQNAFALRNIQKELSAKLGYDMGDLAIISCSAHIYETCWNDATNILKEHRKIGTGLKFDPSGNFLIEKDNEKITVCHCSPDGKNLKVFSGTTAKELYNDIIHSSSIIDPFHAAYLGYELAKAESALQNNEKYVQDRN